MAGARRDWWVHDAILLALCGAAVCMAVVLTPGSERVALLGWQVPEICVFKTVLGLSCPGCGMTRSWVYLAHGDLTAATQMHLFGPLLLLTTALQVPLRATRLVLGAARNWRSMCPP